MKLPNIKPWIAPELDLRRNGLPNIFYFETVLACNLACPECVIGVDAVQRTKKIMKLHEFEIICNKIKKNADMIYLHKWGEPLMNKQISQFVKIASDFSHTHISTNGIFLDEKKIEEFIEFGLGTLLISVDAINQETYEKYRIGGNINVVLKNLKQSSILVNKYKSKLKIIPQFIVFEHNEHQMKDFQKFCEDINLKSVFKAPYIRYGDKVKTSNNSNYQWKHYQTEEEHFNAMSKCNKLTTTMTIDSHGEILLCPQDYNNEFNIGNILDPNSTLKSIWNDSKYVNLREQTQNKRPLDLCKNRCMFFPASYKKTT